MKFMLEILGMTNYCNLDCLYCDWEKKEKVALCDSMLDNAKTNLKNIHEEIQINNPEVQIIEYSGGEPFMYPEIIEIILNEFNDKWIRLITNGLNVNEDLIQKLKKHGKTFVCLSLDGHNIQANYPRLRNDEKKLEKILLLLDRLVSEKIPVMILCTINKYNIDSFKFYLNYLEDKYEEAIGTGMLVMPAHYVTNYCKDNGKPDEKNIEEFAIEIKKLILDEESKIINSIKEHYEELIYFMLNNTRKNKCTLPMWSISTHFREDNIINSGEFLSFGCGMRGVKTLGTFLANNKEEISKALIKSNDLNLLNDVYASEVDTLDKDKQIVKDVCFNTCFVDWTVFDLILNNKISYETAEKWFIIFKDENIKNFFIEFKSKKNNM